MGKANGRIMQTIRTPRFDKEFLTYDPILRNNIRILTNKIRKNYKTGDKYADPHELEQFRTEEFEVWSWDITTWDRLVFEVYKDGSKIVFTNCRNHQYRGTTYSEVD